MPVASQDAQYCFGKRFDCKIWRFDKPFRIASVEKNRIQAGRTARNHVVPAIPDHVARFARDPETPNRLLDQTGLRLAAEAAFVLAMRADQYRVDRSSHAQPRMHGFKRFRRNKAVPDVGLVCHYYDDETRRLQVRYGPSRTWQQTKVFETARRIGFAVSYQGAIQHAVPIKKNRRTLSLSPAGYDGCLTRSSAKSCRHRCSSIGVGRGYRRPCRPRRSCRDRAGSLGCTSPGSSRRNARRVP